MGWTEEPLEASSTPPASHRGPRGTYNTNAIPYLNVELSLSRSAEPGGEVSCLQIPPGTPLAYPR